MIRYFGRLLLFILILVGIKWALVELINPFNFSPDALAQKIQLLNEQKAQVNTLFIGSSRTYTALIPDRFDSLTQQTRSLNLGASSVYMPHTANLCQQLLSRSDLSVRYILFELSLPAGGLDPFLGSPLKDAGFLWQHWSAPSAGSTGYSVKGLANNLNKYVYELLSPIGQLFVLRVKTIVLVEKLASLKAKYVERTAPVPQQPQQPIAEKRLAAEEQPAGQTEFDIYPDGFITSQRRLNRPSPILSEMYQRGLQVYQANTLPIPPSYLFYVERLKTLHQLAAQRGVKLVFFLPNRLTGYEASVLIPIFRQLAPEQRLAIPHDAYFDQLFEPRFSMDNKHLNEAGARIYTTLMAEAFRRQGS